MNLSMISNYLKAKWSKGVDGKKVDVTTKDIRLLSCFGDAESLHVCPALKPSQRKMGKFYCNDCNCGDKATTWLNGSEEEYTKLDHPYLSCPHRMPGFSDYESYTDSDDIHEQRKLKIETILGDELLNNKDLVKPEMSEDEKNEMKEMREIQHTQRMSQQKNDNKGGCASCKQKAKIREEIENILEGQGLSKGEEEYKQRFKRLWEEKSPNPPEHSNNNKVIGFNQVQEYVKQKVISMGIVEDDEELYKNTFNDIYKDITLLIREGNPPEDLKSEYMTKQEFNAFIQADAE